jgi:hypothetical protein
LVDREAPHVAGHVAAEALADELALAQAAALAREPAIVLCGGSREGSIQINYAHRNYH